MFWKRYYKGFPARMEIIANNAIIVFCHLVKFAIFAVTNFFSLFRIAVFNIPITHIIVVLLFLLQSYCFFRYFQTFFNFFHFWRLDLPTITNFVLPVFLSFPAVVFRLCAGPGPGPGGYLPTIIHTRIHAHTYTRARGFLDRNF